MAIVIKYVLWIMSALKLIGVYIKKVGERRMLVRGLRSVKKLRVDGLMPGHTRYGFRKVLRKIQRML